MAAFLLFAFACAPPNAPKSDVPPVESPTPSPTPAPTSQLLLPNAGFHGGEVGIAFVPIALQASGGRAPYHWTVSAGVLPPGLTLGADGSISGTPTTAGKYWFTVQVADSGDSTAKIDNGIGIADPPTASLNPNCASYCRVELGCADACGDFGSLSGGDAPFTFSLASGSLPAGTALNGFSLKGTFGGSPGYLKFTVQVTDALGGSTTISPTFWMYSHIAWSGTYYCNGSYVAACQVQVPFSGGVPGGQPLVTLASVGQYCPNPPTCPTAPPNSPSNMSATSSVIGGNGGGTVTVTVPANCGGGCRNGYYGAIGLVVVDQALCGANSRCQTGVATVDVYMAPG